MCVLGRRWRAEDDRQFGQAAKYQSVAVAPAQRRSWDGQPHGGEAAVQGGERDQAFRLVVVSCLATTSWKIVESISCSDSAPS